jgi:hypothetical protein
MGKWLVLLGLAYASAQETVILQTTPPTRQQQFNQAMQDLNKSLYQLGEANRANQALGMQQAGLDLERKKFELEVLDRAIRFEKEYPGEPNPYREFMRSLQPPTPLEPTRASKSPGAAKAEEGPRPATAGERRWLAAGLVGIGSLIAIIAMSQ